MSTYIYGVIELIPASPYIPAIPAKPAIPSATNISLNVGWTGGAWSIPQLVGVGGFQFNAKPDMAGGVVGLIENPSTEDYAYLGIEHGFAFMRGDSGVSIIERGVTVMQVSPSWALSDVWKISRDSEGVVTYWLNDVPLYVSAAPSFGARYLEAQFYIADDFVDNPKLITAETEPPTGDMTFPFGALSTFWSEDADSAQMQTPFGWLTCQMTGVAGIVGSMDVPFGGLSAFWSEDARYAEMLMPFGGLATKMDEGGLVPTINRFECAFGGMKLQMTGIFPLVGKLNMAFGGLATFWAEPENYAELLTSGAMSARMEYADKYIIDVNAYGIALGGCTVPKTGVLVFDCVANAFAMFECTLESTMEFHAEAKIQAEINFEQIQELIFEAIAKAKGGVWTDRRNLKIWTFNLDNAATSAYENFGFSSFARIGDHDYGCKPDGVYRLGGHCDDGEPIHAAVGFGKQKFGTSKQKHVASVYVGVASTGKMVVKVTEGDSGRTFFYAARSVNPNLQQQRIDLGRGLRANWFEFELLNEHGCDFDLESIEFAVVPSQRRI